MVLQLLASMDLTYTIRTALYCKGRGVSGVLEADFIKPTHDKQDFEKSQLYQKLINRLKDMTNEYWDIHYHKIGYSKPPRSRATPISPVPLAMIPTPTTVVPPLERNAPAPAISFAQHPRLQEQMWLHQAHPQGTPHQVCRSCKSTRRVHVPWPTDLAEARKGKGNDAVLVTLFKRQATHDLAADNCSISSSDRVCQYMGELELKQFSILKLEDRMLREECLQFETEEKELLLKEQNLRRKIEKAQEEYKSILNEYVSVSAMRTQSR